MRTERALELLEARLPVFEGFSCVTGTKRDAAFLRVATAPEPGRWAVVSTPGDRWFSLDVDGGYSADQFEEGASAVDVNRILDLYVEAAVAYLRGSGTDSTARSFMTRALVIPTSAGPVVLRRSLLSWVRR